MRPFTLLDPAFLAASATSIPGGGGGGGAIDSSWTPNGGTYTPGMAVQATWAAAPAGAVAFQIYTNYYPAGEIDYRPADPATPDVSSSVTSPYDFTALPASYASSGELVFFIISFYNASAEYVGYAESPSFTRA